MRVESKKSAGWLIPLAGINSGLKGAPCQLLPTAWNRENELRTNLVRGWSATSQQDERKQWCAKTSITRRSSTSLQLHSSRREPPTQTSFRISRSPFLPGQCMVFSSFISFKLELSCSSLYPISSIRKSAVPIRHVVIA